MLCRLACRSAAAALLYRGQLPPFLPWILASALLAAATDAVSAGLLRRAALLLASRCTRCTSREAATALRQSAVHVLHWPQPQRRAAASFLLRSTVLMMAW